MGKKVKNTEEKEALDFDGEVISMAGGGFYNVKITEPCIQVLATLSGRLRQFKIHVIPGDFVRVELSPYDLTRGRITYRYDKRRQ